ncbi:MAG: glutaminyl-peptide cyclotransferase, partial [Dehalococcoidia bacterium]|nr:glutaminyl-peptide cyclotransferase [Dehalococcoidia bacterium]
MALPRGFLLAVALLLGAVLASGGCSAAPEPVAAPPEPTREWQQPAGVTPAVTHYSYEVVGAYPHDEGAFTQGLTFDEGFIYEGTGQKGKSSLRKVALETGAVAASVALPDDYFGEGIAI